jgi:glycosyltransferase involved in cell wall biosynthesis
MKPLRIGIDVHSIGSQSGGNQTYYHELVRALAAAPREHHFILYYTMRGVLNGIGERESVSLTYLWPSHRLLRIPLALPWLARHDRLDVFHAQYIVPPLLHCKTVTTIHDIAYEYFPQHFPIQQRAWLKTLVPRSAKRADHIITVSKNSKRDLVRTYGINEDKITVTYGGASSAFRPIDRKLAKKKISDKYQITDDFILYVGRLQARKNIVRLVGAYDRLRKSGDGHKLVLVGKPDSLFEPVLSRIRELRLENDVLLRGHVPDEDLPYFYSAADVFVYPSLYEGFGLPVMESMACGTPVVTSLGSSLDEVAGNAALLIDPLDELSIVGAMKQMLGDPQLAKRLTQDGLRRSQEFSFRNAARQTIDVYERLMQEQRPMVAQGN